MTMTYLVTGATGGLGGYALRHLMTMVPANDIVALARSEGKAEALCALGVEVRIADYADRESLGKAFSGVDRMLFISGAPGNRRTEHTNVVEMAVQAGVSFIAYTSFAHADQFDNFLSADHQFTEGIIADSGVAHTFLRNNWYLENEMPLLTAAMASGELVTAAGDATVGWALKREYGEAAARVLAGGRYYPEVVELSGPATTYAQLGAALAEATGKDIAVRHLTGTNFSEALQAQGMPVQAAQGLLGVQQLIGSGDLEVTSDDFATVLGKPLTPLAQAVKEVLG